MGNYIQLEEERDGRGGARARGCGRGATCVVGTECCGCTTTICYNHHPILWQGFLYDVRYILLVFLQFLTFTIQYSYIILIVILDRYQMLCPLFFKGIVKETYSIFLHSLSVAV